jgi:hypothetical protein
VLKHEYRCDFSKLLAWQDSAKLKWAESLMAQGSAVGDAMRDFVTDQADRVCALRERYWRDRRGKPFHPMRWTGGNLSDDSKRAEKLQPIGFVEYYTVTYPMACWQMHGSGAIGLMETPPARLPFFSAQGFADSAKFAIAAARHALDLIGQCDAIVDARFEGLAREIGSIQFAAMPPAERNSLLAAIRER